MTDSKQQTLMPSPGMLATVRESPRFVSTVDTYDSTAGRFHLVNLEYIDADGVPSDTLLWEREPGATLLEPNALPQVSTQPAMRAVDFDALQRATRWTALNPFFGPDESFAVLPAPCTPRKLIHVNSHTTPMAIRPPRAGFALSAGISPLA